MKTAKKWLVCIVVLFLFMLSASIAVAQSITCVETIRVTQNDPKDELVTKYKVFWKNGKWFRFQGVTEDKYAGVIIVRDDQKRVYLLQPHSKTYMTFDYVMAKQLIPEYLRDYNNQNNYKIKDVGAEKPHQGHPTFRRIVTITTEDKREVTFDMLLAVDLSFWPLRIIINDPKGYQITQDYEDISTTELPDELFAIPEGYNRIILPNQTNI